MTTKNICLQTKTPIQSEGMWLILEIISDGVRIAGMTLDQWMMIICSSFVDTCWTIVTAKWQQLPKRLRQSVVIIVILDTIIKAGWTSSVENPFVNVLRYLDTLPKRKKFSRSCRDNFEHILNNFHPDSNKQIRDKVILLLNYRYNLKPSQIVRLNVGDVNLQTGLINLASKKKRTLALRHEDILAFRQWSAIRQMYQRTDVSDNAFLISLHWTLGRGLPYCRLSTRAVNKVINRILHWTGNAKGMISRRLACRAVDNIEA